MNSIFAGCVLLFLVLGNIESFRDTDFNQWPTQDVCIPRPKGRVPWILHVRDSDYGWGEHTHRANIALAVNENSITGDDKRKTELQLEVELTRALFRSKTSPIHDSDLALYIHALLATKRNPRNFHGTDLVADLLRRVNNAPDKTLNPFLVLALCNSHAVEFEHLLRIEYIVKPEPHSDDHPDVDSREAQLKAIALKAYACAADFGFTKFGEAMEKATQCLMRKYNRTDGSFGNVYTTSLAVQAFTAYGKRPQAWDEDKSLSYLEKESEIDVNLIKAYYIELALNARRVKFIKHLYGGVPQAGLVDSQPDTVNVMYTVKGAPSPSLFFTLNMRVTKGSNFYDVMKMAANASNAFRFSDYRNREGRPMIYSIAGIPNDAEENMFWRLCRIQFNAGSNNSPAVDSYDNSPVLLTPGPSEHLVYWYRNAECEAL